MFNTLAAAVTNASMFDTPVPLGCLILSLIAAFIVACLIWFRIDTKHGDAIAELEVERDNAVENAQVRLNNLTNLRQTNKRVADLAAQRLHNVHNLERERDKDQDKLSDLRTQLWKAGQREKELIQKLDQAQQDNASLEKRLLGVAAFAEGAIDVSEEHFDDYLQSLQVTDEEHEQEDAQGVSFYTETATEGTHAWKLQFLKSYRDALLPRIPPVTS